MNFDAYVRDKLKTYQHADLCRRDIINALTYYKELKSVQQKFVHNDGRAVDLLALEGTIPIKYKGASYHIPICIWITEMFPFVPPLVYVKPTNTMAIKVSKHVDANGRVFLPFLHEWSHPRSDLSVLLQIMTCVFAEDPPVYSKPVRLSSQPPSQYPAYPETQATSCPTVRSSGTPKPQLPVPGEDYDSTFKRLKARHGKVYSNVKLHSWTKMLINGTHNSEKTPPDDPIFESNQAQRSCTVPVDIGNSNKIHQRGTLLQQLAQLKSLYDDEVLSHEQFISQRDLVMQELNNL